MILAVSAYTTPFRAILSQPDGGLAWVYRPAKDIFIGAGLFEAPWEDMIQGLLKDGVHPDKIQTIVVLGKPLILFEMFLHQMLIPPAPAKIYPFAIGVKTYLSNVLRISSKISGVLRFKPDIRFVSLTDVLYEVSARAGKYENVLFWDIQSEIGKAGYYRKSEPQLMTFPWLEKVIELTRKGNEPESLKRIVEDTLAKLDWRTPGLVWGPKSMDKMFGDSGTALIAEEAWVPLLAVATDIFLQLTDTSETASPCNKTSQDISPLFQLSQHFPNNSLRMSRCADKT
jgi:hypothetical protein